jgi:hypothetical protein
MLPMTLRRLLPAPLRRAAARVVAERRAVEVSHQLAALARQPLPIAVGPWLGEVGFELLYWVPFVRWFAEQYEISSERLIAVSRGGAASWYASVAGRSVDALAFMAPRDFRGKNESRAAQQGEQKQIAMTPLDEEVLAVVRREHGEVAVFHPSLMYRLFAPYWWGHQPLAWVRRYTRYARLQQPELDLDLPAAYTAVKFYFNDCFPATAGNRAFVDREIRALSDEGPVVSLSTAVTVDGHTPCEPDIAAMQGIRHLLSPQTNLLVQSAVVARATRFVGTYGGFAYLAPFYGVPARSYYTDPDGFSVKHLNLARDVLVHHGRPDLLQLEPVPACSAV